MKTMRKTSLMISLMLIASIFVGFGFIPQIGATTTHLSSGDNIQNLINSSTAGDLIILNNGWYTSPGGVLGLKKSITLRSANGSDYTHLNGTINISVNNVQIGAFSATEGITVTQSILTVGTNAIEIATNGSRNNVSIYFCDIMGGYNGIQIGRNQYGTHDNNSNMTLYSNTISGTGASGICSQNGYLNDSYFYANQIINTSNGVSAAAIKLDGMNRGNIYTNSIHDTETQGGAGINITGSNHYTDKVNMQWNFIYNTRGYSPIVIRSLSAATYVRNMRIMANDLGNYSHISSAPGIRFDNISGKITATNISVFYNKFNTSNRDIEERFALTAVYSNWTGVMPAYFNWFGHTQTGIEGTFRVSSHLLASPYLLSSNAYDDIIPFGTLEINGVATRYLNNSYDADTNVSGTSTASINLVVYPYPITLLTSYPTRSMHKYIEIGLTNASRIAEPANITIYYTTADLAIRDWSERYIHGLVYYNSTSGEWEQFNNTGVSTNDTMGYEGFVWANVYQHLSGAIIGIDFNTITPPVGDDDDDDGGTTPVDSDGDGLTDSFEEGIGTNPDLADTDGDGFTDYEEYLAGGAVMALDANSTPSSLPTFFGFSIIIWIIVIIIIAILVIFIAILVNPKTRRKWLKMR